ncbi:FAD/NAD(P)-binding domain-containing protein [Eremomyces bilateralis CBS 781.70]|uniref:FAD/NAD(P)-binding domain-containing protein n=1 Tax=Eremomyces bilateralis CBS 781.70 TaxID=1392243 RepID=A0A6G1G5S7_9PEZI|nr:FAD/NAD(P)-binding domain-containing protein [Eremomyces bilateralis CBS 781.70]KAF1813404.1 FAD/NAD(P)-binding domain-containing protein [Eremomyces bilateralis CBS 781.70]
MEEKRRTRVAIVGSGMAGLVTAYLLNRDQRERYDVTVLEQGDKLSLDSASVSVPTRSNTHSERIDVPMRAFAGGYYNNLKAMYDFLEISYHSQPFLFAFSEFKGHDQNHPPLSEEPYFIHASNNHRIPPPRPAGVDLVSHIMEIMYLLFWYSWFTVCCLLMAPLEANSEGLSETLEDYTRRIRLPLYFSSRYLLPLIASVTTCPRDVLLQFPARDVVDYKLQTHGAPHYTVSNGVKDVQTLLARDIRVRFRSRVISVKTDEGQCSVSWRKMGDGELEETITEDFDRVVLAVAPDVVGEIFAPLQKATSCIPTTRVKSVVHTRDACTKDSPNKALDGSDISTTEIGPVRAQLINIRSCLRSGHTEAAHFLPSEVVVTTCPLTPLSDETVISSTTFTRVLRSPSSRDVINRIMDKPDSGAGEGGDTEWRNGDDNIWLVGGWCWDGMVLLEGCMVSAMRVADEFDVLYSNWSWASHSPSYLSGFSVHIHPAKFPTLLPRRSDTKDFQTASESLLLQLLKFAGLRSPDETPSNHRHHNLDVLDLGYGCGDQILALLHAQSPFRLPGGPVSSFRLNKYVGITFNQSHCDIAGQRVGQRISHRGLEADVQLFCGDAANPDGWSRTLLGEAESLRNRATERNDGLLVPGTETWVLALDSMYHFSPSRLPVLKYARQTLDASLMTFDLVLADDVSSLSRLALSMVAKMLGCPFGAFMPVREYREMLRTAGYEDDKIQIQDISEHVFEPLSQFIERQTVVLQKVGINIGKFALAKHLFRWWANSGSVRGMMVVARTSEQNKDEDVVI